MKTNRPFSAVVPAVAIFSLLTLACSSEDEDYHFEDETPVPTSAPAPTPVPIHDFFRVSRIDLDSDDVGVDLNGDGNIDNGLQSALQDLTSVIIESVEEGLLSHHVNPALVEQVVTRLEWTLPEILTPEHLTELANYFIQDYRANMVLEVSGTMGGSADMNWYVGQKVAYTGLEVNLDACNAYLGTQSAASIYPAAAPDFVGDLAWLLSSSCEDSYDYDGDYYGGFGIAAAIEEMIEEIFTEIFDAIFDAMFDWIDDIFISFKTAPVATSPATSISLEAESAKPATASSSEVSASQALILYAARTEIRNYNTEQLNDVMVGGAISIYDLEVLSDTIVEDLESSLPPNYPLPLIEDAIAIFDRAADVVIVDLEKVADFDLDGQPALSIGMALDAEYAAVAVVE